MPDKTWRTCRLTINGLTGKVQFNQDTIDNLFFPFLRRLTRLHDKLSRRITVFMAAPPGAGKSTLALLLAKLSLTGNEFEPVQAIGLDGFHYPQAYLNTHTVSRDAKEIPLAQIKGAPETFDVVGLKKKLALVKEQDIRWPVYDRRQHDVVPDIVTIRKDIVLLEGNWLLLREDAWQDVKDFADYTLFITAKPEHLWQRLVARKIQGGLSPEQAARFYERTDRPNIDRVLRNSWLANETWKMLPDGDYVLKNNAPRPITLVDRASLWKRPQVVADDDDFLSNLHYKLSQLNTGANSDYMVGFSAGLAAARDDILRRIYRNGSMDKEELCRTFKLTAPQLEAILNP